MSKAKEYIGRRTSLLIMFAGLLVAKCLNYDGVIDDAFMLIIGAIVGKEVLSG